MHVSEHAVNLCNLRQVINFNFVHVFLLFHIGERDVRDTSIACMYRRMRILKSFMINSRKALKFLSAEKTSEVKAELRDQIQQLQIANNTLNSNSESQPPTKKKALDILFGKEESNAPVTMEDQVDLFFSETRAPRNSDPLAWWKANSLRYPRLSQLVKPLFASNFHK